jgi:hypothetical protein
MLFVQIIAVLVGYSIACLGAGVLALTALTDRSDPANWPSAGTELATAFILGQGLLASLWLLLALAGWLSPLVVAGIALVCAFSGVILARRRLLDFVYQVRSVWRELTADSWGWQVLAGLTVLLCLAWGTSLGRSVLGDAAAFYLALAKFVAASHRLVPLPGTFESFTTVGLQGEMHYTALMALGSPDAAQLFAWPTILVGAVMLLALGRQTGLGRRGQWIALAMLFSSSAVIWLSGDGKVDLFAVTFGFAAYYWAVCVRSGPRRLALLLTGLFSGFALVAKLSYVPILVPSIALLVGWGFLDDLRGRRQWKSALKSMTLGGLQILLGLAIAILPHLIKNGLLFHNPIAPFGMGGMSWVDQTWFGPATTRRVLLTYPLALTFGSYWAQYGDLSPLVLAFFPLALLLPRPRSPLSSPIIAVMLAALAGTLAWVIIRPSVLSPRYILAILLLFILLPARAAEYISYSDFRPRWLTAGVMGCMGVTLIAVGLYFLGIVFFPENTYRYLSGKMPECGRDTQPYCRAMVAINHEAAPGDRVFLASFYRYWLREDLSQCVDRTRDNLGGTPEAYWLAIYQGGFRYLLADRSTHSAFIDSLNLANPPDWLKLTLIFDEAPLTVYRLDVVNPPAPQLVTCRQRSSSSPIWEVVPR